MSFILDALKKSESDRQRQSGPSLFEVKVAPPRRRLPIWAAAIAVLLGINAIVVSWMLLRRAPAQPAAASSAVAAPPPSHTIARTVGRMAPGETAPARGAANAVSAADGTAAREPVPAAAPAPVSPGHPGAAPPLRGSGQNADRSAAQPASAADSSQPASAADSSQAAPAVQASATGDAGDSQRDAGALPLYQQVVGSDGLPELHLDLHVFARSPKDRFVMINMHRLGEGDSLPNGVHVDAIRPDGAVLSYHGTQFLLPRD